MTALFEHGSMPGLLAVADTAFPREVIRLDKPHVGARMQLHAVAAEHVMTVANGPPTADREVASVAGAGVANAALVVEPAARRIYVLSIAI